MGSVPAEMAAVLPATGPVKLAVIGGSGLYKLEGLEVLEEINPTTPWGQPSSPITIAQTQDGHRVAFLARHGNGHAFNPSEVPFRANIAALKGIGVEVILAFSAVGSLQEEIRPGDFVLPDQLIDRTKGIRASTFFEKGAPAHAPFADPFHAGLTGLVARQAAQTLPNLRIHQDKTLICMEGPAFSTRAESRLYRSWGGDIINMSAVPEAKLAREAEIAYQMVCMSTDYDCWRVGGEDVTVQSVMETMAGNSQNARLLLHALLPSVNAALDADATVIAADATGALPKHHLLGEIKGCMKYACMTRPESMPTEIRTALRYILPEYF
ncbi:nucleoside phosphorylase domain-containing protein [Syncephalis plumigaleata]|nr:nucleoside phosphorylase domain-containing protein [Syncephalis plumigaleata]